MRKILLLLFLIPVLGFPQLYYTTPTTGSSTPAAYVYDGNWTVPTAWVDSLGAIDITDGQNLAASTIKILVNTRTENNTFAFKVTAANGYTVKWGKKETAINYTSATIAERTYDTTKCQKYCVIEITKTGAGAITAFTVSKSTTFVATQAIYPCYLWVAANYVGASPIMATSISTIVNSKLEAVWLANCTSIANYSYYYCYSLKSVTIPTSVTNIVANSFQGCSAIRSVTIPSSVTTIGNSAFISCCSLTSITLPSSVTSLGTNVFQSDYSLQTATLGTITNMQTSLFASCIALESVTIPSSVTTIGNSVFNTCTSLQTVSIPSSVTSIGTGVFNNCYSLRYVTYAGTIGTAADNGTTFMSNCEQLLTASMAGLKTTRIAVNGAEGLVNKLGSAGNLAGDSIPIRINFSGSTFSNGTAPQFDLRYCSMTAAQLSALLRALPVVTGKTIDITGNPGTATCDPARARANGWTVTGPP